MSVLTIVYAWSPIILVPIFLTITALGWADHRMRNHGRHR